MLTKARSSVALSPRPRSSRAPSHGTNGRRRSRSTAGWASRAPWPRRAPRRSTAASAPGCPRAGEDRAWSPPQGGCGPSRFLRAVAELPGGDALLLRRDGLGSHFTPENGGLRHLVRRPYPNRRNDNGRHPRRSAALFYTRAHLHVYQRAADGHPRGCCMARAEAVGSRQIARLYAREGARGGSKTSAPTPRAVSTAANSAQHGDLYPKGCGTVTKRPRTSMRSCRSIWWSGSRG